MFISVWSDNEEAKKEEEQQHNTRGNKKIRVGIYHQTYEMILLHSPFVFIMSIYTVHDEKE